MSDYTLEFELPLYEIEKKIANNQSEKRCFCKSHCFAKIRNVPLAPNPRRARLIIMYAK